MALLMPDDHEDGSSAEVIREAGAPPGLEPDPRLE